MSERYTLVNISVQLRCESRGVTDDEIKVICCKLAKAAKGKSKSRNASAMCGKILAFASNDD